jgi:LysM domain/Penicillin-insensitive murein endopeptidase
VKRLDGTVTANCARFAPAALAALLLAGCAAAARPARVPELPAGSPLPPVDEAEEQPATVATNDSDEEEHDDGALHDAALDDSGGAAEPSPDELPSVRPHPLDTWTEEQIASTVRSDLPSLGPMSLGSPNAGALLNGVQAEATRYYEPISPSGAWATRETLDYLSAALAKVHDAFPETAPLALGDISGRHGGPSSPHVSHQSGRDVDIAYFYQDGAGWYARGTAKNLDLPRNWAFVRALISETDVDLILIDHSIQALLEGYARARGEDPTWLTGVFRGVPGKLRPIIRHAPGHATHIHVRFFNPMAQETARRCHAHLLAAKLTSAPQSYIGHKVKKNETLGMISRKYGVPVPKLRAANGLKKSLIREKSVLRIPVASRGAVAVGPRLRVPARRIPPAPRDNASAEAAGQPPPTK